MCSGLSRNLTLLDAVFAVIRMKRPASNREERTPMKKSLAVYVGALVALAMFAPTTASAQVNIYVGPGNYGHYGYGYGYPRIWLWLLSPLRLLRRIPGLWLLRRISRLLRRLLGPWASGSTPRLASSQALGLVVDSRSSARITAANDGQATGELLK